MECVCSPAHLNHSPRSPITLPVDGKLDLTDAPAAVLVMKENFNQANLG